VAFVSGSAARGRAVRLQELARSARPLLASLTGRSKPTYPIAAASTIAAATRTRCRMWTRAPAV